MDCLYGEGASLDCVVSRFLCFAAIAGIPCMIAATTPFAFLSRHMAEDYIRIYQQLLSRSSTQAAA